MSPSHPSQPPPRWTRRQLARLAATGGLSASMFTSSRTAFASVRPQAPGIKLGIAAPANPSDDDLLFFKQLGVDCVFCAVIPEFYSIRRPIAH